MIYYSSDNIDDLFLETSKALIEKGETISPRGMKTVELQHVWLELTNMQKCIVNLKHRKINKTYLKNELKWYLSGSLKIDYIKKYSSFWEKLVDSNGTINSNYGNIAFIQKQNGKSQFEWCVDAIKKDINTRQAIINYNQPLHKYENNKDFVCTIAQHFMVRNGKLDTTVFMRSNDLIYGFTYDAPWFCLISKKIAKAVGLKLGTYRHYAASLHVYERHFNMLHKICKNTTHYIL
jgi:thymidylate synthase|tara:strand:+ start:3987 stop:4691 length:705 start_codon:yes stop_codon:yes gene_type:complete